MLTLERLQPLLREAFGRLLSHVAPPGTEVPEDLAEQSRLWSRLKAERSRSVIAESLGLDVTELSLLDACLRDVERTTRRAEEKPDAPERNALIASLRLLSWLETVGDRTPSLALAPEVEALVSEDVGRKQVRALELILRSLIQESYGDAEHLVERLREALSERVVDKWRRSAASGDILTGATFSELASLFVNREEFGRYERLYEDTPFLTLLKQRRKTLQSFLEDVRRVRNDLAHHKPVTSVGLTLLDLYYEEIVRPVQTAHDEGETKVDPSAYLDVSREELEGWYGRLREDVASVKDEIGELRSSVLASLGALQADQAEIKEATQGVRRRLLVVGGGVGLLLLVGAYLVVQGQGTSKDVQATREASAQAAAAARAGEEEAHRTAQASRESAERVERAATTARETAEAAREAAQGTREATEGVKAATEKVAQTLEELRTGFEALTKEGGVIADATRPEELYHNARVYEQRGDTAKAIQSFRAYFASGGPASRELEFVDPHLEFQSLLKLQGGLAGAREVYHDMMRADGRAPSDRSPTLEFAWDLLLDEDARRTALGKFLDAHPDYAPAVYELSRDYSVARLGTQSIADKRKEKALLQRFLDLERKGPFLVHYLDQSVAADQVKDAKERLAALSTLSDAILENPVRISGFRSNAGWTVTFSIADTVKEILYRIGKEGDFQSTGFVPGVTGPGGLPLANPSIQLTDPEREVIQVKYVDPHGRENGPFDVLFDPDAMMLQSVRGVLGQTKSAWLQFREFDGKLLLYFTHLISYRVALKEIRYGLDVETPDQSFPFSPADPKDPYSVGDDVVYLEVPSGTKYATVQVVYVDGSSSEVVRIAR